MTEVFDVERAIAARLESRTDTEKEDWKKFQESERSKLPPLQHLKMAVGQRMTELATTEMTANGPSPFEMTRLAEGYALMGCFVQAAGLTADPEKRKFYQQVLDADSSGCEHDDKAIFFDSYPGGITLYICPVCRHLKRC